MKNIRVGILTLPFNCNYGGVLQTYALQTYLKNQGYETYHIYRDFPEKNKITQTTKDVAKLILGKTQAYHSKGKHLFYFFDKYVTPKTHRIRTLSDLKKLNKYKLSTIIVGSDQVWRKPCIYGDLQSNYFLDFATEEQNKISYAASFGIDNWQFDEVETTNIENLIKRFNGISVREKSGVELCKTILGVEAKHLIDPVMLLKTNDYEALIQTENEQTINGDCLVYLLDESPEKNTIASTSANFLGYSIYNIDPEGDSMPSVTNWLKSFSDAKFVVTDSFHGCMFSILFNKPFLVIGNKKRGLARFTSILTDFNLLNRMILDSHDDYKSILNQEIEWKKIKKRIQEKRLEAQNYLQESIK